MSKVDFEDFMLGKHCEQYVGTKDGVVDDSADWITELDCDDWIMYGNLFACEEVLKALNRLEKGGE